jgi:hypothetical protein
LFQDKIADFSLFGSYKNRINELTLKKKDTCWALIRTL